MYLLFLIPLLGLALSWQRISKSYASIALMQTTAMILVFVYFGGIIGALSIFSATVWVLGSLLFVYEVLFRKFITINFQRLIPYFIFITLSIIYFYFFRERYLFFWDEFSHWGIFAKEMIFFDRFHDQNSNASHLRYLPGTALWQYLVNYYSSFEESGLYFAQFLLIIVPLMVFFERLNIHRIYWIIPILIGIIIGVYNFGHGIANLYVDHLIGVWFVGMVAVNFFRSRNIFYIFGQVFPYGILLLIKDAGALFAMFALAIFIVLQLYSVRYKFEIKSFIRKNYQTPLLVTSLIFIILFLWNSNRNSYEIPIEGQTGIEVLKGVLIGESSFDATTDAEMRKNFWDILSKQQLSKNEISWRYNEFSFGIMKRFDEEFRLTTMSFFFVSIVWLLGLTLKIRDKKIPIVMFLIIFSSFIYLFIIYRSYFFAFGRSDFPSYIRYFHSIALSLFLFSLFALLPAISFHGNKKLDAKKFISILSVIFVFWVFEKPYLSPIIEGNKLSSFRQQIQPMVVELKNKIKDNGKIWVYFPIEENGFMRTMLRYEITPNPVTIVHSKNAISEDIGKVINSWKQSNYLWFPVRPPQQESGFSELFTDSPPSQLYKVSIDQNNLSLQPL
jgi:hypothetical protein